MIARPAVLLLAGAMTACSFAPHYRTPDSVAVPPAYQEAGGWQLVDASRPAAAHTDWWRAYGDPQLDALEARIGDANQNLKAALARLQQARADTRIARADLFPTLNVGPTVTRTRTSVNSPRYPTGDEPVYNNFDLEADFSYEIDLWGRVRNSVSAAKASEQASAADLAAFDLAIRAELAADYFSLRGADTQQVLLDSTVDAYGKALALTKNLYDGGAAALADVAQAEAQLESARTLAADIRLQRAQTLHAIAVLLGENPSAFQLTASPLTADYAPPPIDPGVAAANAGIGVARAAYFPVFSLVASAGYDSTRASTWLQAPSRTWSVGPTALLTVFDAGRHRAQSAKALAVYDEQVADYRSTVLTAYQDVEDNLAALRQLQLEGGSEAASVKATATALQQAQYRYKAGLVTYLEVATTENAALQAQLASVDIQLRRLNASVLLVKALGGGWQRLERNGS